MKRNLAAGLLVILMAVIAGAWDGYAVRAGRSPTIGWIMGYIAAFAYSSITRTSGDEGR